MKRGERRGRFDVIYYSPDFETRLQWTTRPGVHLSGPGLVESLQKIIQQIEKMDESDAADDGLIDAVSEALSRGAL